MNECQQCPKINDSLSKFEFVNIRILQGSILFPILYLLYMNDLPMHVSCVTLFADDTMISVSAKAFEELIGLLQKDIDNLIHWLQRNKLTVNLNKSCSS